MFFYLQKGTAGWVTALAVLLVTAALIAGPRFGVRMRWAVATALWVTYSLVDSVWFLKPRHPDQFVSLVLAVLPILVLGTAVTIHAASRGGSALVRVANFVLAGGIGVLLYPFLLLLLTCAIGHRCP